MTHHQKITPATWPTDETVCCPDCDGSGYTEVQVRNGWRNDVCAVCAGDKRVPLETAVAYMDLQGWSWLDQSQWLGNEGWCLDHRIPLNDFECVICDAEVAEARRDAA